MRRIYYHKDDFDGQASGAVCADVYSKAMYHLYPLSYGQEIPVSEIADIDSVLLLDFCPDDPMVIREMIERSCIFYWIDHHETSRRMYKENNFADIHIPPGVFITDSDDNKMSACELAYMFLHNVSYDKIPYYIKLLGRYDVWDFTDRQTLPFQYGMRAWLKPPTENMQQWKRLLRPSSSDHKLFKKLIDVGKYVAMYENENNKRDSKSLCFGMDFHGYRTLAINRINLNSLFFDSEYNPKIHDLILQFGYKDGKWVLGFRSNTINCADLAEKYGGGGHSRAAGAVVEILPKQIKDFIHV